jgi:hypothetical protein
MDGPGRPGDGGGTGGMAAAAGFDMGQLLRCILSFGKRPTIPELWRWLKGA